LPRSSPHSVSLASAAESGSPEDAALNVLPSEAEATDGTQARRDLPAVARDPVAIRGYAQAAEQLGYCRLLTTTMCLAPPRPLPRPVALQPWDAFHEPMVLFGYLAGVTKTIELVTGILVLPQRQTALVAEQAAEVDFLSEGRLAWAWASAGTSPRSRLSARTFATPAGASSADRAHAPPLDTGAGRLRGQVPQAGTSGHQPAPHPAVAPLSGWARWQSTRSNAARASLRRSEHRAVSPLCPAGGAAANGAH